MDRESLKNIRNPFTDQDLLLEDCPPSPWTLFEAWLNLAAELYPKEPNAMSLATCLNGKPSQRTVLLRMFDENGLIFFTNYLSKKGREIEQNPKASVLFYWPLCSKQIRVEGLVEKSQDSLSEEYFLSRPAASRASAIASTQSAKIDQQELKARFKEILNSGKLDKPKHWGGYCLKPNYFEFWQGKTNRLHDRVVYELENGTWKKSSIAP